MVYGAAAAMFLLVSCDLINSKAPLEYPETAVKDSSYTFSGVEIQDPYLWLEDDRSEETEDWVRRQNEVTFGYLGDIPYRDELQSRMEVMWNYEKLGTPFKSKNGSDYYYSKNDGLQNQSVIYKVAEDGEDEVFLDPNTFSKDGTTSMSGFSLTADGSLVAYSISEGGSDWRKVIVMETATREIVGDTLVDVKFSGISWRGNEGFYYSSYDKPEGSELSAKTDQHKLYFHRLGQPQSEDELIFGGTPAQKYRYVGASVSEDQGYLAISAANSTSGNRMYIQDLSRPGAPLLTVQADEKSDVSLLQNRGSRLLLTTNRDAPNQRVVEVDASNPGPENWQDVIPETENVLSVSQGGGYIFASYMIDAITRVYQYDYRGNLIREIELPGLGTASGFGGWLEDAEGYFSFRNYYTPGSTYKIDYKTGAYELYWTPEIDFNPADYTTRQVFFRSKDSTRVPMFITHKKGLELEGNHPTILYGYGGFNISQRPGFSATNAIWLEQGGIYAVANLRGGGEYGKEWHLAGTKMNKQNVFDDFIAAAEYLIDEGYTSSEKLAIRGGSNGGLLVGATMTQRPELFQVALPAVGVMDMLRYNTFTAGAGWAYDYGTAEDGPEMLAYLKGYSPVHNVKEGVSYPATLVTTGDHDDRVVPAHSFKFAAQLQAKHQGEAPVLIRIETNAGHGAGKPLSKRIQEQADVFGFTLYNMGYESLPVPYETRD